MICPKCKIANVLMRDLLCLICGYKLTPLDLVNKNKKVVEEMKKPNSKEEIAEINEAFSDIQKVETKTTKVSVVELKTMIEAEAIANMCIKLVEQFKNKNLAYADSFGKQFEKYGPISALVRMSDKFSRIEALSTGTTNNVKDESLEDTLMDMTCYCLMMIYELRYLKED